MPFLCREARLGLDAAARGLDRRARALGDRDALQGHGLLDLTREHHLGALGALRHYVRLDERGQIHHAALDLLQLVEAHLGARALDVGAEADLGHAALDRHLSAFEADLVVAALAGTLALGAAAAGLALAGGGTAADAQPRAARARSRFQCIESHRCQAPFSTRSRCTAVWIMPRFSAVSFTVTLWRIRRSPSPRAEAAMFFSCPFRLFTSVTFRCLSAMTF